MTRARVDWRWRWIAVLLLSAGAAACEADRSGPDSGMRTGGPDRGIDDGQSSDSAASDSASSDSAQRGGDGPLGPTVDAADQGPRDQGPRDVAPAADSAPPSYNSVVLAKKPVGFWNVSAVTGDEPDLSGHGHTGKYSGSSPRATRALPNGDRAVAFDGQGQYLTVPDSQAFSVSTTGALTVEAWLSPTVLQFPDSENGYVHWMGKGVSGQQEWVARMYDLVNSSDRPNRISGYAFNLTGGLGAGSYFQDALTVKQWIHYVLVINAKATSASYPAGYTKIFRDGKQRDKDSLAGYSIVPRNGTAPLRIATRDLASFFKGAVGKVAIYPRELTAAEIAANTAAMNGP